VSIPAIPLRLPLAFLDSLGGSELVVILVVVLIFFGGEKMPEFARGLGKAIREFKKAAGDVEQEFKRAMDEAPAKTVQPALKTVTPAAPPVPADPPAPVPESHLGDRPAFPDESTGGHGIDA
jgi:TatA/E family protein of Tat protein translocase